MSDLCSKLFYCCVSSRSKVDYDNVLADSEREAVADLLNYLENVILSHRVVSLLQNWQLRYARGSESALFTQTMMLMRRVICREPRPTSSLASR